MLDSTGQHRMSPIELFSSPFCPACCPALGSDHFLRVFSLPTLSRNVLDRRPPSSRVPAVRDWASVLGAIRPDLEVWASSVQQCLSVPLPGVAQRSIKIEEVFSNLRAVLDGASRFQSHRRTAHRTLQLRWWTDGSNQLLVARNAAWRDYRSTGEAEHYARFSHSRLLFHRLVQSLRRTYWRQWQDSTARLSRNNPRACAHRIRQCFRLPVPRGAVELEHRPSFLASSGGPCDRWRDHFSTVNSNSSHHLITSSCSELTADRSGGLFDAPFSEAEPVKALGLCHDSAPGDDGLRYSIFQADIQWRRNMVLRFHNLILQWSVVPASWKVSTVVPVFKRGDVTSPDDYRPIALVSCAFKVFERLVHGRIASHICDRLDEGQGRFRWEADTCVCGLVDALLLRQDTHTFATFVDIRKAFDTSWIEATLVRLWDVGVTGGMWRTIANFLCGTLSQVRDHVGVSAPSLR